jgi:chromosome segregation ATPase
VTQDVDIQLQAWKDLAISKQVLMNSVTKALGLTDKCSNEELRSALDKTLERADKADINIKKVRDETDRELAEMREQLKVAQKGHKEAEQKLEASEKARAAAEHQLKAGKADNAEALKKAKAEVANKQKELKAINKVLADTPENVVKKLRQLKKQRLEEANAKNAVEKQLQSIRKELNTLKAEHEAQNTLVEQASELAKKYRELHAICVSAAESASDVEVPVLNEELLSAFDPAEEKEVETES